MIELGPHAVFIVSAYVGVILVVAAIIVQTLWDGRQVERRIGLLEAHGARRRGERPMRGADAAGRSERPGA